jgi:hypothetical protein
VSSIGVAVVAVVAILASPLPISNQYTPDPSAVGSVPTSCP